MTTTVSPTFTSLRDPLSFPSFETCPHKLSGIPWPYFLRERGVNVYSASQHWCFLGEITDTATFIRLRLWVRDKDGESSIPIAFHLDARGGSGIRIIDPDEAEVKNIHRNLPNHLIKKGNTIAVLYAERHNFVDGTIGLRIEDGDLVQIFPCDLEELLGISDRILLANRDDKSDGDRVCGRCGGPSSHICSGCRITRYCGKASL